MMFGVVVIKQFVAVSLTGLIILIVSGAIIYILECLILAYFKDELLLEIISIARKTVLRKLVRH